MSSRRKRWSFAHGAASLAMAVTLLALAAVGSANHSIVERVSTGPLSDNGPYSATFGGASADGTRVFFETDEPLQLGDTDTAQDVYERSGGTTTRISTGNADVLDATFEGISADGTRVFFSTAESLAAGDTDGQVDIYERFGGTTTRISTGLGGGNGAFGASFLGASADGTRVFFATGEPLEAGDTDAPEWDIYERFGGTTTRISTGPSGGNSGDFPFFEGASADGTRVFFQTDESLEAGDTDSGCFGQPSCTDVYQRSGGTTTRISTGPLGGNGPASAYFGGASAGGTRVFFYTEESLTADDLDNGLCLDGRGCNDVYERSGGTTTKISTGSMGGNGAFGATFDGISADGSRVFFRTNERLETGDMDTAADIYQRFGETTTRITTGSTGGNGDFITYFSDASADGARVFFSTAESLEPDDTDTNLDIYERFGGTTTRITTGPSGGNGDFYLQFTSGISADGTRVFLNTEEPLDPGDTDACQFQRACFDVYERFGGTTTRLSTGPASSNGSFNASIPQVNRPPNAVSADGTRVFFSTAESLVADDTDSTTDVYVATVAAYARPKGATPIRVPLVIAYETCQPGSANRTHGPPLAHPSCAPPVEQSDWVTTGTPDANGQPAEFIGSLRFNALAGNPATPADEADLKIAMDIKDVRRKDNLADYVGEVAADTDLRITDRFNATAPGGGSDPATMVDVPFPVPATCSETADPAIGSTCAVVTSIDALVPGAVKEGKRAIWEVGQPFVSDGGADGDIQTNPNTVFARQGVFVP